MTKAELIEALERFDDDETVMANIDGDLVDIVYVGLDYGVVSLCLDSDCDDKDIPTDNEWMQ